MPRIDLRTPRKRRAERLIWGAVYVLVIACGGLLGYLGLHTPEASVADTASPSPRASSPILPHQTPPAPAPGQPKPPEQAPDAVEIKPPPREAAKPAASFFGIPVE